MNTVLWVLQILVALMFLLHGGMLLSSSTPSNTGMAYIGTIPTAFRRFVGLAEFIGSVGLILPGLANTLPWLTPLAATGLVLIMIGAVIFHTVRREYPNLVLNFVLLAMAAFIAYGRFVIQPF